MNVAPAGHLAPIIKKRMPKKFDTAYNRRATIRYDNRILMGAFGRERTIMNAQLDKPQSREIASSLRSSQRQKKTAG